MYKYNYNYLYEYCTCNPTEYIQVEQYNILFLIVLSH